MTHVAVSVTAILVLAAFALDRITKGVSFLLSFPEIAKRRTSVSSCVYWQTRVGDIISMHFVAGRRFVSHRSGEKR